MEIVLAPHENRGNRLGVLPQRAKDYIDKYHHYENPGVMAKTLGVNILLVINYCTVNRYTTPIQSKKKPKTTQREQFFCVDTYAQAATI